MKDFNLHVKATIARARKSIETLADEHLSKHYVKLKADSIFKSQGGFPDTGWEDRGQEMIYEHFLDILDRLEDVQDSVNFKQYKI